MTNSNSEPNLSGQNNLIHDSAIEIGTDESSFGLKSHLIGGDEFDLLATKESAISASANIVLLDLTLDSEESVKESFIKDGITVADAAGLVRSSFLKK